MGVDVAAGHITGTSSAMQYSFNSTNGIDGTWMNASATNTSVTFVAGKVYVRQAALPTNFHLVTTISASAITPTGIAINVALGQITGTKATQEYSLDGGTNWSNATAPNTAVTFTAGNSVVVREKATANALASVSTTPINVVAPAAVPAANKAKGKNGGTIKLTGLSSGLTYQYVIDSNATLAGNAAGWSGAALATLPSTSTEIDNIVVNAGQYVHLRVMATATHLASNVQDIEVVVGDIKSVAEADAEDVALEKAALTIPAFAYNNATILQPLAAYGTTITWARIGAQDVKPNGSIGATGTVGANNLTVRGDSTDTITFEATITKGASTETKQFVVTIF